MQRACALFLTALSLWGGVSSAHADPITQLVVFGDSLSDVGNTYAAAGVPPAPYYQGHYSNGPIWVEQLATRLGVAAPTPSLLGGSDYAFGGAETGTGFAPNGVPNVLTQVGSYLASNVPKSSQLFVLWAGANNFFNGQTNPLVPVMDLGNAITTLAAAGAKQFLVPNYANLAQTPYGISSGPAVQQGLTALTLGYNQALSAELLHLQSTLGIHITQLDTYSTFQNILNDPAAYGFSDVTTSAVGDANYGAAGYLFWDDVHPTTAGHEIISDAAYNAVAPEPTSLALFSTGALGFVAAACRRRRVAALISGGLKRTAGFIPAALAATLLLAPPAARSQSSPTNGDTQPISAIASPMISNPDSYPAVPVASPPAPSPAAASPPAWRFFQESKLDATWLPSGGGNGLGIADLEISTVLNIPLVDDGAPLLITPYGAAHDWMRPTGIGTPSLPSHLYDLNVELAWRPRVTQWLFADLAVTPGLYTDFKDVNSDSFRMRGRGLAIIAFSEQLQLVGGVMYVNRNQIKLLPAGGVIWNPSDDTRCFLVFPQPKVSHRFATVGDSQFWAYLAGEFGGGRWEIERANGTPDSIDYTDLRALLGIEAVTGERLKEHVEVGYVFSRRVNFTSDTPDYRPQSVVMLRAGIRY